MSFKLSKLVAVVTAASLALVGCSNNGSDTKATEPAGNTIVIEDNFGPVDVPVPPKRVAVTDNRIIGVLDEWNIPLVAAPKPLIPSTMPDYKDNPDIVDLGSHKEPNLEALVAADPDLILNGQRYADHRDKIKEMNPQAAVVELDPREDKPLFEELKRQVTDTGEIFGKQAEAQELIKQFDDSVARAKKAYNGTDTVLALNSTGGEFGFIAPGVGRVWGPVYDELGLKPALEIDKASSNHKGDDISVEKIVETNPNWIFVLDRDGALSLSGGLKSDYTPAVDAIEKNTVLDDLAAVKEGRIVVAPQDTYLNESIITYTKIFNSIADAFEAKG